MEFTIILITGGIIAVASTPFVNDYEHEGIHVYFMHIILWTTL